ncbi:MAG: alpha/beta hydrolase-fold protein [Parvularculaceae bacterium]|nr:alpha/beta hydrolase-fold protein [Parvularculaceae bacterium]
MRHLAFVILAMLGACASGPERSTPVSETRPIIIGEQRLLRSSNLGDERQINVWLPPSYGAGLRRYPVLYVIDGALDQDFEHIAGLAQYGAITGQFEELIVVGVQTKDRRAELTSRSTDAAENRDFPTNGNAAAFRAFLTREVMPLIDARYRTNGTDALLGESLAGLFIAETFLKHPHTADSYVAISPSLWWDGGSLGREARGLLDDFPNGEREIYLAIASESGVMRTAALQIVSALKKERPKGVAWTFSDRTDLEHATIYHREALEALIWAFPPPQQP